MPNELFTRKEVANIFSVDPLTVRAWEKNGKLPVALHVNGKPRYALEDIEKIASKRPSVSNTDQTVK